MTDSEPPPMKRLKLTRKDLEDLSKEDLVEKWMEQEQYVDILETRHSEGQKDSLELVSLRESEDKMRQQQLEATRRENLLVMRLAAKEQEMQECAHQIQELKQAQTPGSAQLRSTLLDPAVNLMFERMKKELLATKAKLEETQNELSAWKFTPDSNTGKRLMAKCRQLYQENEELGKMISSGRMAKLEGDLALQKNFSEEMKKSQAELDEFLLELDEDVEGMQSTILYLQQQLRTSKEQVSRLQNENQLLLTNASVCVSDVSMTSQAVQSPRSNSLLLDCPRDSNPVSVGLSPPPTENHIETNGEHVVVAIVDGVQTISSSSEVVLASACSPKPPSPIVIESNGQCVTVCFEAESKDMPLEVHVDDTSQDFLGHGGSSPDRVDSTENTRTVDQIEELSSESLEPLILEETEPNVKEAVDLSTTKWVQLQEDKTVLTQECKEAIVEVTVPNGTGDGTSSVSEEDT